MKQTTKRLLSVLLVLCMVLSVLPASVFAAPDDRMITVKFNYVLKYVGGGQGILDTVSLGSKNVKVNNDGTFNITFPEDFEWDLYFGGEFTNLGTILYEYKGSTAPGTDGIATVTYDADSKTAKVSNCTEWDANKTYAIDVFYNQLEFTADFKGLPPQTHCYGKGDDYIIPQVPEYKDANGNPDTNKIPIGWASLGMLFVPDTGYENFMDLFNPQGRRITKREFEPAYVDRNGKHLVLWTDSLTGEIYSYEMVLDGATAAVPVVPTKNGYTFNGWDGATDSWTETTTAPITEDTIFKVQWSAKEYSIETQTDYCTVNLIRPEGHATTGRTDETIQFSVAPDEGYALQSVYARAETGRYIPVTRLSDDLYSLVMPAAEVTIMAMATALPKPTYTLSFYADNDLAEQLTVTEGEDVAAPAIPAKEGYEALCWKSGNTRIMAGVKIKNVTANSRWDAVYAPKEYAVNFYSDVEGTTLIKKESVHYGEVFTPPAYSGELPEGKTFIGWQSQLGHLYLAERWNVLDAAANLNCVPVFADNTEYWLVKFVVDGAVYDARLYEQKANTTPTLPANPTKEGYEFIGWHAESIDHLFEADTALYPINGSETYTARFAAKTYTITTEPSANVALTATPDKAPIGTQVVITATAQSGYETNFVYAKTKETKKPVALSYYGASTLPGASGKAYYSFIMPAEDVTVSVEEKATRNTAKFIVDNELYAFEYVKSGEAPAAPTAPVKEGYTFTGWTASNGKTYAPGETFDAIIADETYTAEFEKNTYKVTLVNSEHVTLGILPENGTAAMGDKIVIGAYAQAGYESFFLYARTASGTPLALSQFGGEPYDVPDANGYVFVMPAEEVTVTVVEKASLNTVKFIVDGALYAFEYVKSGEVPTAPAEPVKEGYTFTGWRAASDDKLYVPGAAFDTITADETYTAEFEINTYDLTYYRGAEADASEYKCILELPDGTFVEFFNNDTTNMPTYAVKDVTYGDTVKLGEPMLPGYLFKGWVDESGYMHPAGAQFTMPAKDVLLTAVWEVDQGLSCLVRFVSEGQLYYSFLAYDGQKASIPATDPTADGKLFKGWQYGDNTYTNDGVKEFTVKASDNREMTLEAVWENNSYTVTYIDGDLLTTEENIAYGEVRVTPAAPEKEGYTFVAWENKENGAYYLEKTAFTVTSDRTFTAVWAKDEVEYAVKFFDEKGNLVDVFVVADGTTLTAPTYEQGRPDAEYLWIDAENHLHYAAGESIVVNSALNFRATLQSEAEYTVAVKVTPDDAPADVTNVPKDTFKLGEIAEVTINVPEGYLLKAVSALTKHGQPVTASLVHTADNGYSYYIEMPADDVTVTVELWKIPAGKTAVKFMVGGELFDLMFVTKGENGTAPETAPTKAGSIFRNWQKDTTTVSAGQPFAVAPDAEDVIEFHAVFAPDNYIVEFNSDGGVPQPPAVTATYGETIELPAAPMKTGSKFVGWREETTGFVYGANGTYLVKGNAYFTAIWATEQYIVRFIDSQTNQVYGYELVEAGATVIAPAGPVVTGRTFVKWENADGSQTLEAGKMTAPIFSDTTFYAVFENNQHSITVVTDNCSVAGVPTGMVEVGAKVSFTAAANERYAMASVVLTYTDGLSPVIRELHPDADGSYTFTMPDADVTVTATAVQNVFAVHTRPDANCTVAVDNDQMYFAVDETVRFTVTASEGYVIQSVYAVTNGTQTIVPLTMLSEGSYAFVMPAEDVTILATAKKADYTVTYLDADNTLLGIVAVAHNELADAPVASKDGYKFVGWEKLPQDGTMFDPATDKVTENLIVRAVYEGLPFTVEAGLVDHVHTLSAECTISSGNLNSSNLLLNPLTAEAGKDVYFTVAADYDYVITGVAIVGVDGSKTIIEPTLRLKETIDGINYYTVTFTMPAENVKIDVYTAAKLFRVDVEENNPAAGDYTINGFHSSNLLVPQGEQVTIDIQPIPGYEVVDVTGTFFDGNSRVSLVDFTLSADKNQFTFPMVARDVLVEITYAPIEYSVDVQTSNFESYKPDASVNPAKVVESLDPELTSKGRIELLPLVLEDYTNADEQVYKIPANGTAIVAQRVCFQVVEYTGYQLASVTVTYDNGERTCPLTLKDGKYYFDMPADDVVITAVFVEKTYQVKKDAASELHGTVEMNGLRENIISVDYKNEVNVTVTPDDGYQVSKIYYELADGTVKDFDAASYENADKMTDTLDTAHSITFHAPATTVTVYVEYTAIDYTIDDVCANATVSYTTPHTVGEQVTFTTKANDGYIITKVYVVNKFTGERVEIHTASTNAVYGATYTFTMPAAPVTIHVNTVEDEYNVVYLANGSVVDYEDVPYLHTADVASRVAMVENAPAGYHFVGWTSKEVQTPVTVPSVNNADFVVIGKTYIVAAYEKDAIDVHFLATENGTVTELSTGNTAEYVLTGTVFGDTVKFTAVPAEGYVIDEVKVTTTNTDGYNLDVRYTLANGEYSFVIPATYKASARDAKAEDVVVAVTFKKGTYTLTKAADCGTDGVIAVNGKVTTQTSFRYDFMDEVNITATPNAGYYVASITAVCADGSHKFEATGTKPATDGVGTPLTLSFAMPACDLTFTVVYAKIDYSITCVYDAKQGKIETAPAAKAQLGDVVTVTVTPEDGYELLDLTVTYANGEKSCVLTQIAENKFTFTMPADAVVVTATFTEITYTANLTVVGEANVTLNGFDTDNIDAKYLDTVTVNVTPAAGWELVSITVDGGAIKVKETVKAAGGKYTFTMPEHDVDIVVTLQKTGFALDAHALNFFEIGHGKVTLTPEKTAYVGDRVVITADPDDGYRVKEVVVQDEKGFAVPVSFLSGTPGYVETWSFTMPAEAVTVTVYFEVQGASYFTDVRTDHWFYDAVTFVTDRGYFRGIEETLFAPNMNMDRAMFVTVIGRIYGVDVSKYTTTSFKDVEANAWYTPYVAWAAENGIVLGRDETTFDPYANISREEMAAIMYRFCKFLGCDMTLKNEVFMDRYEDAKLISPWAEQYVQWAVGIGLMRGRTHTTIDPLDLATRAEVAQVIKNLCDKVLYQ